jgi:hypothetical protein
MRWFGWFRGGQSVETRLIEAMALQEGTPVALMGGRMRTMGLPYALPRPCNTLAASSTLAPERDAGRWRWRRCSRTPMWLVWM